MKKILGILMALTMASSFSMTTMADDINTETHIQPKGLLCQSCGIGNLRSEKQVGNWRLITWYPECKHGKPKGSDELRERYIYTVWTCSNCSYSDNTITDKERQMFCFGGYLSLSDDAIN